MKKMTMRLLFMVGIVVLASSSVLAVPTIGNVQDFADPVPSSTSVWDGDGNVTVSDQPGYLSITVTGDGNVPGEGHFYTDTATDPDGNFVGSYVALPSDTFISFEFRSSGATPVPSEMYLYFMSNGSEWRYFFDDTTYTTGWNLYSATIGSNLGGWNLYSDGGSQGYSLDLDTITEIGVFLVGGSELSDIYQFRDFEIGVPEPETVWMILAVALSLGMTFRGRLAGFAGQMKARLVKA